MTTIKITGKRKNNYYKSYIEIEKIKSVEIDGKKLYNIECMIEMLENLERELYFIRYDMNDMNDIKLQLNDILTMIDEKIKLLMRKNLENLE